MKKLQKQNHMVDSLFPMVLFFLFTFCAVVVLLLSIRIYESITDNSYRNNVSRTALTYVSEKIHQNDCGSSVSVEELDGIPALKITHTDTKDGYVTYIYCRENELQELFIRDDIVPDADAGSRIANVTVFDIMLLSPSLLQLSCEDEMGNHFQTLVGIRSIAER